MIQIRQEAEDIITGKQPQDNNVLKNAPHPLSVISLSDKEWNRYVPQYCQRYMDPQQLVAALIPARQRLTLCHGSSRGNSGQLSPVLTMVSYPFAHCPSLC